MKKQKKAMIVFEDKQVRRVWHKDKWYFSIVDIVTILVDSVDSRAYWRKLKQRLKEEGNETVTNCHTLKMSALDGKMRSVDVANTEELFRLIQSIPSRKVEPLKRWLARIGYERVQEIENPELAQERMKEIYKDKGYSKSWIEKRVRGISVRQELTDEWIERGVEHNKEFALLTNDIMKAAFGKTVKEYKSLKGLEKQNLRDHMDDIELILTMLGEASTTRFTKDRDSQTIPKLQKDAKDGGIVAGSARKNIEGKLGKSVVSKHNYLQQKTKKKKLK